LFIHAAPLYFIVPVPIRHVQFLVAVQEPCLPDPRKGTPNFSVDILDKKTGKIKTRRYYNELTPIS
jgi:hypothetical protein